MKRTVLLCLVSAVAGCLLAVCLYGPFGAGRDGVTRESGHWSPPLGEADPLSELGGAAAPVPVGDEGLTPDERINVAAYQAANRSAVNICTKSVTVQTDFFFRRELTSETEGSGTVIDRQGHILTNAHVVEEATEVQVTLYNGKTFAASVVGLDLPTDVAVLKIDAPAEWLHPVSFGSSSGLRVGQRVFAIGNPFGLERTLSTGIISSLNRSLPRRDGRGTIKSIIQIDAAINPGNSGGPLLDTHARMIGMNTAIASKTGESAGVGFAIPVNTILRIVPQLIDNGRVIRPELGIARGYQVEQGLLIAALTPGGPAEKAGLQGPKVIRLRRQPAPGVIQVQTMIDRSAADIITAIDGQPVHTTDDLMMIVESKKPGDEVVVSVIRDGKPARVEVRLEAGQ
jgi:S1-C subfamily serine protease